MSGLLNDIIGDPVLMLSGRSANLTSDKGAATDLLAGVGIKGMGSVLFLVSLLVGTASDTSTDSELGAATFQVQYSSTGTASDSATSNATMSCTDAIITFSTASAVGIYMLEFNIAQKGLDTAVGKLFGAFNVDSVAMMEVVAIPVPGTSTLPITKTTTVVVADD